MDESLVDPAAPLKLVDTGSLEVECVDGDEGTDYEYYDDEYKVDKTLLIAVGVADVQNYHVALHAAV